MPKGNTPCHASPSQPFVAPTTKGSAPPADNADFELVMTSIVHVPDSEALRLAEPRFWPAALLRAALWLVRYKPEEPGGGADGIRVRAGRAGEVGVSAGHGWSGLQLESGVGPVQNEVAT